jgi:hypothetical protein
MDPAFAALQARLRSLAGPQLRKTQRKALTKVGELFEASIKAHTPVRAGENVRGGELRPGELSASIKPRVSVASDEGTLQGRADKVTIGPRGKTSSGTDIKLIAHDVEYGHGHAAAVGFIRDAFDTTKDAALAAYQESVEEDLKEATR